MKYFYFIRFLALLLILELKTSNVQATILVLVVTNKSIYLGADSKITTITNAGLSNEVIDKIIQKNGIYFAISGISSNDDKSFSIENKINEIIEQFKTFHNVREAAPKILESYILSYEKNLKIINPELFNESMKVNRGGEIFFATIIEDVPWAYFINYELEDSSGLKVKMSWGSINTKIIPESECYWKCAGNVSFVNSYTLSEKEIRKYPICFIGQLIQLGISEKPEYVGEPIKIIELKSNGVESIQVKDDCTNQFFK